MQRRGRVNPLYRRARTQDITTADGGGRNSGNGSARRAGQPRRNPSGPLLSTVRCGFPTGRPAAGEGGSKSKCGMSGGAPEVGLLAFRAYALARPSALECVTTHQALSRLGGIDPVRPGFLIVFLGLTQSSAPSCCAAAYSDSDRSQLKLMINS